MKIISIVIATYNSEKTIKRCINSIVNQTYRDFEVIIQDGASTDNTVDIIASLGIEVDIISAPDNGVYDAWNKALLRTHGKWMVFLGSDDYFYSEDSLQKIIPILQDFEANSISLVYGRNYIANESMDIISEVGESWGRARLRIDKEMSVRHPGCFHHKSLFELGIGFSDDYDIVGDHHFFVKNMEQGVGFYPFSIVVHVIGGLSTSPNNMLKLIFENFRMRKELNLRPVHLLDSLLFKRLLIFMIYKIFGFKVMDSIIKLYRKNR